MFILKVFQHYSRYFVVSLLLLGMINSLAYSFLLVFINATISQEPLPFLPEYGWQLFVALLGISIVSTKIFQTYIVRLTQKILYGYELNLLDKLRFTSYTAFEQLGVQRVYTAVNDVRVLSIAPEVLVVIVNSVVVVLCALGYMCWISPIGGASMILILVIVLTFYLLRNRKIKKHLNQVRDLQDSYHQYLLDLLHGFKEVKMSLKRNETMFHDFIQVNRNQAQALGQRAATRYLDNELVGRYSWYLVLGVVIFLLPNITGEAVEQYISFIVVVLYLMGPLSSLVGIMTHVNNLQIALQRIEQVETDINAQADRPPLPEGATYPSSYFEHLCFEDVVFEYFDDRKKRAFRVGPINFRIDRGEVIFITGGNGSGKSTFINLLTGLYTPKSGTIYLNDQAITPEQYVYFSNQFSAIFTNNYLFEENYNGFDLRAENQLLQQYTAMMNLQEVLEIDTQRQKIYAALSKGQSKRLAMIYALMENRPLMVLDEWAAEQDPVFRAYFYEEIVPTLKDMGKTVIAVTHDDHYFHHCDRLVKFDYGKIVQDHVPEKIALTPIS